MLPRKVRRSHWTLSAKIPIRPPSLDGEQGVRAVQSCDAPSVNRRRLVQMDIKLGARRAMSEKRQSRSSFPRHAALGPYDVLKLLPESEVNPIRRSRSEAMG
jgi:hypothetical protein